MINREKIINGLEHCIGDNCDGDMLGKCAYSGNGCIDFLLEDVLALMRAQEPMEYVVHCKNADLSNGTEFACGECGGSLLHRRVNYCPWCGRAVKWE